MTMFLSLLRIGSKMKENNYIWTPKQYRAYYKAVSIYNKITDFQNLNDFEKHIKSDIRQVQACLDILKMESDVAYFPEFNQDSEALNFTLNNMAESLSRISGLRENKKFASIAISYLLTIKPLV